MNTAVALVNKLNTLIFFPLIALLSAVALLVFVYGGLQYVLNADNETGRTDGRKNITYGIIGLLIMISAYAILSIAAGTFGLQKQLDCADNPRTPGCEDAFRIPNPGGGGSGGGPGGGTPITPDPDGSGGPIRNPGGG